MGQRKSKLSYDVTPTVKDNKNFEYTKGNAKKENNRQTQAQPTLEPVPAIVQETAAFAAVTATAAPAPAPAAAPVVDETTVDTSLVPSWICQDIYVDVLRENVENFEKIVNFKAYPAMAAGENYASIMLRVSIDVQLKDNSSKNISFMQKIAHDNEQMRQMLQVWNFFDVENTIYFEMVPEMEQMYREAGVSIELAPKGYNLKQAGGATVLLEDLRPRGYKNANRLECLDMQHAQLVLRKLAQFHAASATRVATKGDYAEIFMKPMMNEVGLAMWKAMIEQFNAGFMRNLPDYKDGEKYLPAVRKLCDVFMDQFVISMQNGSKAAFRVLNHGDCWSNNILFQYDSEGRVKDLLFVDFQNPRFSNPSQDLLYFIISSTKREIKLSQFDYMIRYYHDNLIENLQLLKYPKTLPTLRDLHVDILNSGIWCASTMMMTLPIVLLDSTDTAKFENFMGEHEDSAKFKKLLFTNKRYLGYVEELLPWMMNRGVFEPIVAIGESSKPQPAARTAAPLALIDKNNNSPAWLTQEYFADIVRQQLPTLKAIKSFEVGAGTNAGDNYVSNMLKVDVVAEIADGSTQNLSYMLKIAPDDPQAQFMIKIVHTFEKENLLYVALGKQLQELYQQAGKQIVFAPQSFNFSQPPPCELILLENLRPKGYKMADRLEGLDMQHCKCVLQKLAQFHAATATHYALKAKLEHILKINIFSEEGRAIMNQMKSFMKDSMFECLKSFKGSEEYLPKIIKFMQNDEAIVKAANDINENEFNVLNHGDLWTNNILFQYNAEGKITDTLLIDYQMMKYGHPALDLYYFLMTSPQCELKVEQFDYFIRYYHEQLTEHLLLLKYPKHIPSYKELQLDLLKHGVWSHLTLLGPTTAMLLDPTEAANFENMLAPTEQGEAFRKSLYMNPRFKKHVELVLPWLNKRGLLDYDYSASQPPQAAAAQTTLPDWLTQEYFEEIVKQKVPNLKQITSFEAGAGSSAGENYASTLLKVDITAESQDGSQHPLSYMLKVAPSDPQGQYVTNQFGTFRKEIHFYDTVKNDFETIYKQAGKKVVFGPDSLKFSKNPGTDVVLLENLRPYGYANANRLEGLDKKHTERVLQEIAKFHAASVVFCETRGQLHECVRASMFKEETRMIMNKLAEVMMTPFKQAVRTYEGHEEYYHKLDHTPDQHFDFMVKLNQVDDSEFNVLNHGDLWTNNILFKHSANGDIEDVMLIDFQMIKYGTPAQDLYYFLISSPSFEVKLSEFDYFVRYYHEHLTAELSLLKYAKPVPTLKELQLQMLKYGAWGSNTALGVMSAVLLDPTEGASLDTMLGDNENGDQFRNLLYTNPRYRKHAQAILSWLNKRGCLDFDLVETKAKSITASPSPIPEWLTAEYFDDVLHENLNNFDKITDFKTKLATKPGDNYASIMLNVELEAALKDGSKKPISYMLKISPPSNPQTDFFFELMNVFPKECLMYSTYLPAFEQLYQKAGLQVQLAPKVYNFKKPTSCETVLLEDLRMRGFKNMDRRQGLDTKHTECVLRKMAQLHAASLCYIEQNGALPEMFNMAIFNEKTRPIFEQMFKLTMGEFINYMTHYQGHEDYLHKMEPLYNCMVDEMIKISHVDAQEFNVLNHGDSWINNIMFKHNEQGEIEQMLYIDFQVCKYGSPAQDLYYFLMSSTQLDIKVSKFDYFIKYYHDELTKHSSLLNYQGKVITLKELHLSLLKYGMYAISTATGTASICLVEPSDDASIESFSADTPQARAFRQSLYLNERFKAHAELVLPWLNRRGLLDF